MQCKVQVIRNPWDRTVPDEQLCAILDAIALERAANIKRQHEAGVYSRDSLGIAILDPTAAISTSSIYALLATISIGPDGDKYVVNAIAKAMAHRNTGIRAGYGVNVDLTRSADGDFRFGGSAQLDNTIGAASAQTEHQDAYEAGMVLVQFNLKVRQLRAAWCDDNPGGRWFCSMDEPDHVYMEMAGRPPLIKHVLEGY